MNIFTFHFLRDTSLNFNRLLELQTPRVRRLYQPATNAV